MKTPAYAKVKAITSMSGANATHKHITTLQRAQSLLDAQTDSSSWQAAMNLQVTIDGYRRELRAFYNSEHYPYRDLRVAR
jgi:hypothetical protein